MLCRPTRPAGKLRAPPPNKNAPTPSTRLLPRYPLKFFELNHQPSPCSPPDGPRPLNPGSSRGFLSCPGLLLERTEHQAPTRARKSPQEYDGDIGEPERL